MEHGNLPIKGKSIVNEESQVTTSKRQGRLRKIVLPAMGGCLGICVLLILIIYVLGMSGKLSGTREVMDLESSYSPDGSMIVFTSTRGGNADIFTANKDGSNIRQLTSNPFADLSLFKNIVDRSPVWSPDGKQILFSSAREGDTMSFASYDIFIMNKDGSNMHKWWQTGYQDVNYDPAWSPDGKLIAYISDHDSSYGRNIYVLAVDDIGKSIGKMVTKFKTKNLSYPDWSPDGSKIVFSVTDYDQNSYSIYVVNADGSNLLLLLTLTGGNTSPTWSPDGKKIVFHNNVNGNAEIYLMNADGSGVTQLTDNPAGDVEPDWSPDGKRILFSSNRIGGHYFIFEMNTDGSNLIQITK